MVKWTMIICNNENKGVKSHYTYTDDASSDPSDRTKKK